jgi:hypothetical protein
MFDIGDAAPPGPPATVPGGASGLPPSAEAMGLVGATADQLGGTDNPPTRPAPPIAADIPDPPPRLGKLADPSAPGLNRFSSPDAPALLAPCKELKPANDCRRNCGLNGPPASAPLVTAVLKKLPLRKVPRAELSEPLSKLASPEGESRFPNNDDSPVDVDVLAAELPLVPAEVPVAWATAAAWPASPAELVVGCGAANGVNCEAAADEPA